MNFLQPWILYALPLMALPILIHLINRHRHRSVDWAAMMFLVSAKRMNKGMARLRYVLIMLLRMLAIAVLVFAVSRPLATGSLGSLGMGKPDATLVLLDRSASMECQDLQTGESKRPTALRKLADLLEKRGYGNQLVLIDSAGSKPQNIGAPRDLLELPATSATATSADIPGMLQRGLEFLAANESGRADVWICSDRGENDWDPGSGRWAALRSQASLRKGVQFYLLSYADRPADNLAIRVANVQRRQLGNRAEMVMDVQVLRERATTDGPAPARSVPIEFDVGGIRSTVELDLGAEGATLQGHRIPIDSKLRAGFGVVTLPGDANPQDNRFYFAFAEPPARRATIVTNQPAVGEAFRRALAIPSEAGMQHTAVVLPVSRASEIDWQLSGLLVWQAPLPTGDLAASIEDFVKSHRVAMFFPPSGASGSLFGVGFGSWHNLSREQREVSWWRGEGDLLGHVESGDPLPLDDLAVFQACDLSFPEASGTSLALLSGDRPLLVRAPTPRGAAYFCATLPPPQYSTLSRDGVAFYVMMQRALVEGSRALSLASHRHAAPGVLEDLGECEVLAATNRSASQRGLHAGVYRKAERIVAVNRAPEEDSAEPVSIATVDGLFQGLAFQRIDDAVGNDAAIASEIWRAFLIAMVLALILEAVLCLPERVVEKREAAGFAPAGGQT